MNKEKIRNCDIPEEIKDICRSCESNIFAQNKGCAFRSLGNEYCDYVLNATRLYLKLQKKAELGEHYKHLYSEVKKQKDDVVEYIKHYINFRKDIYPYIDMREFDLDKVLRMLGEIE